MSTRGSSGSGPARGRRSTSRSSASRSSTPRTTGARSRQTTSRSTPTRRRTTSGAASERRVASRDRRTGVDRRDPARAGLAHTPERRRADRRTGNRRAAAATTARHRVMLGLVLCVGGVLSFWLVQLQTVDPEGLAQTGEEQRLRSDVLPGYRGAILDRAGHVLAVSSPADMVVADPTFYDDPVKRRSAAELLAPELPVEAAELERLLVAESGTDRFRELATGLSLTDAERLAALWSDGENRSVLDGVFLRAEEARSYPSGTLARSIVGRVDDGNAGSYGIEWQFDELLTGSDGRVVSERGQFGSITGGRHEVDPARTGYDLVLTIDSRLQYITEESLLETCAATGAKMLTAALSSPATGEILAMATVDRAEDGTCRVPRYNAALVDAFEPGSVLKVVAAAAAVEELGWTAGTNIEVPLEIELGDKTFLEDHIAAPATYSFSDIIARSSNNGTITAAQAVGTDVLQDYVDSFGFGRPTGLDFKGETNGRVADQWFGADLGSNAIGQGLLVNAVQVLSAYNVIANDGLYVAPRLVRSRLDADGSEVAGPPQETRQVISAATADEVTRMLVNVVDTGTGTAAAIPDYTVAGKTGTAWQVFEQPDGTRGYGNELNRKYAVSFAGFMPAENPALSIVVVVHEPTSANTAGKVAAPAFAEIAQYAMRILNVAPSDTTVVPGFDLVRGTPAAAEAAADVPEGDAALGVAEEPDTP